MVQYACSSYTDTTLTIQSICFGAAQPVKSNLTIHADIADLLDSLKHLDYLTNDIFERIEATVELNKNRIDQLNARIEASNHKIKAVSQNSSRATVVVSSSKCPSNQFTHLKRSIFGDLHFADMPLEEETKEMVYFPNYYNPNDMVSLQSLAELNIDLEFDKASLLEEKENINSGIGVFPFYPKQMKHASDMLLFNTDTNVYKHYKAFDNLEVKDVSVLLPVEDDEEEEEGGKIKAGKKIADAPKSLVEGETLPSVGKYDVAFKPKMKELASLELPSNLREHLPDIADIGFTSNDTNNQTIAPSLFQDSLPELPAVIDFEPPTKLLQPPALPSTDIKQLAEVEGQQPSLITLQQTTSTSISTPLPQAQPQGKSDLLLAIQNASIKSLRKASVADTPLSTVAGGKSKSHRVQEAKPLSLADEMREKLARRQKALSGQRDEEEQAEEMRHRQLRAPLTAVAVVSHLKVKSNSSHSHNSLLSLSEDNEVQVEVQEKSHQQKCISQPPVESRKSSVGFSLDNIAGLSAILQAREQSSDQKAADEEQSDDSDWD